MPLYEFIGGDGRDYFPADIGHAEPGDLRDMKIPPDANWRPATQPAETPPAPSEPDTPIDPVDEAATPEQEETA